jgi:hypothetical protein
MSSLGARGIARARGREREGEKRERKERGRESFSSNNFFPLLSSVFEFFLLSRSLSLRSLSPRRRRMAEDGGDGGKRRVDMVRVPR